MRQQTSKSAQNLNENWLALLEYSAKHNVSISTLRRRIKYKSIEFKLMDGKYFIKDESTTEPQISEPTSHLFVDEIKKAYTQILHEKEEQIFLLKEEISDLKTLVKVLEFEVQRLTSSGSRELNQIDL